MTAETDDLARALALLEVPPTRPEVRAFRLQSVNDDAAWCGPAPGVERADVLWREPLGFRLGGFVILALGLIAFISVGVSVDRLVTVLVTTAVFLIAFAIFRRVARTRRLDARGGYWDRMLRLMRFVQNAGLIYEQDADPRRYAGLMYAAQRPVGYVTVVRDFPRNLTAGNLIFDRSPVAGVERASLARGILMLEAPTVTIPELVFTAAAGSERALTALGLERRELEGDFPRHYSVWHPPGYGRDALHVVQPDLMAELVDHGEGLSMEVIDGCLIITWPRALRLWDPVDAAQVWRVAAGLRAALRRMPASWRDERKAWDAERIGAREIRRRAGLRV